MSRDPRLTNTMRSVLVEKGSTTQAHIHGIRLVDRGSCDVPEGRTLTLEEWKAQQSRPTAA